MQQYKELLETILEKGTWKEPARENMPRTLSLFGAQCRYDLQDGFPLLTTKKMHWKGIVVELLWFLRGDTNIKYLIDNDCNIWNEDAYQYFLKVAKKQNLIEEKIISFGEFISLIKDGNIECRRLENYKLGDCGFQYGKLWRKWEGKPYFVNFEHEIDCQKIDQLQELIIGLKNNPDSRRHLITALNPAHYNDLALFPCHVTVQFNCRPLNTTQRIEQIKDENIRFVAYQSLKNEVESILKEHNIPKYYLDCHLYQRSADVFLGVPYNIASYSLFTHIISEICNMIPGDFIHSFGDVHIYENHLEQVHTQLSRECRALPRLRILANLKSDYEQFRLNGMTNSLCRDSFEINNYNPHPKIEGKLSTGLK